MPKYPYMVDVFWLNAEVNMLKGKHMNPLIAIFIEVVWSEKRELNSWVVALHSDYEIQ